MHINRWEHMAFTPPNLESTQSIICKFGTVDKMGRFSLNKAVFQGPGELTLNSIYKKALRV